MLSKPIRPSLTAASSLAARLDDDRDRLVVVEQRPGPGRVAAVEADVDRASQVRAREVDAAAGVEDLGASLRST